MRSFGSLADPHGRTQAGKTAEWASHHRLPLPTHKLTLQCSEQQPRQGPCYGGVCGVESQDPCCCREGSSLLRLQIPSMAKRGRSTILTALCQSACGGTSRSLLPSTLSLSCGRDGDEGGELDAAHTSSTLFAVQDCKVRQRWRGQGRAIHYLIAQKWASFPTQGVGACFFCFVFVFPKLLK